MVVWVILKVGHLALRQADTPELNGNVLRTDRLINTERQRRCVKVLVRGVETCKLDNGRSHVRVRGGGTLLGSCLDAGTADNHGHLDVRLEAAHLARVEAVLTDVEAIVRGIEYVRIIQNTSLIKLVNDSAHHFVYSSKCSHTLLLVEVIVFQHCFIELGQVMNPTDTTRLVGVEVLRSGDLVVFV